MRALLLSLVLPSLVLLASAGCLKVGAEDNPPPDRPVRSARSTPAEPAPSGDDWPVIRDDATRLTRIGPQRAVAFHLEHLLSAAEIDAPARAPLFGSASYWNPWAQGAAGQLSQRMVREIGSREQWDLQAAIAMASPARVQWPIETPPDARLELSWLVTGTAAIEVSQGDNVIWTSTLPPVETPQPLSLALASGALSVRVSGDGAAWLIEPVITTGDPATLRATTGLAAADNVLLVIVDAQRADTVGALREARGYPPFFQGMEALAAEATNFTTARAVSNQTRQSTFGLYAGQMPRTARVHNEDWDFAADQKAAFYAADPPLMARLLRRLGYRTFTAGDDLFLFGNQAVGLDAGFDAVTDHRDSIEDTKWMTDTTLDWITRHKDQRFFVALNYNAPHQPYMPPDDVWFPFKERMAAVETDLSPFKWSYLAEIDYVDQHLRRVMAHLKSLDLDRRTIVILTSDHGEIMDDRHDCVHHSFRTRCLYNHGRTLFDEEVRVPLLISQPGRIKAQAIDTPVSHLDFMPTVLGLLGVAPHPRHQGTDWSAALLGTGPEPAAKPIHLEARMSSALVADGLKYVISDPRMKVTFARDTLYDPEKGNEELYDLVADPHELTNLATKAGEARLGVMRERLRAIQLEEARARPVWTNVRFSRGVGAGKFRGVLRSSWGVFVRDGEALDELPIHVDVADEPVTLRFHTAPVDATVELLLTLDGEPLDADRIYVGPYGLALLDEPALHPGAFVHAVAAEAPSVAPGTREGVFIWRSAEAGTGKSQRIDGYDADVRRMMKDWGYQ